MQVTLFSSQYGTQRYEPVWIFWRYDYRVSYVKKDRIPLIAPLPRTPCSWVAARVVFVLFLICFSWHVDCNQLLGRKHHRRPAYLPALWRLYPGTCDGRPMNGELKRVCKRASERWRERKKEGKRGRESLYRPCSITLMRVAAGVSVQASIFICVLGGMAALYKIEECVAST